MFSFSDGTHGSHHKESEKLAKSSLNNSSYFNFIFHIKLKLYIVAHLTSAHRVWVQIPLDDTNTLKIFSKTLTFFSGEAISMNDLKESSICKLLTGHHRP